MGEWKPTLEMIDLIGNLLFILLSIFFIYYMLTNDVEIRYLAIVPCFFLIQGILGLAAWKRRKEA